jgi:hypothetical protein
MRIVMPRLRALSFAAAILGSLLIAGAPVAAQPTTCAPPVPSQTQPGYTIADPWCDIGTSAPFAPLTDAAGQPLSEVFAGIDAGAAWRIEVPLRWNGELVVYAHGYRGIGMTVWVDNPTLRAYYVARGFAWAASSYQVNGYAVGQGARDSHAMIARFQKTKGVAARAVYLSGPSMGGHITAVTIERFRDSFVGAMPYCGVLGDAELFDFYLDVNVTAAALTHTPITFPLAPPPNYWQTYRDQVVAELPLLISGLGTLTPVLTPLGEQWADVVERRSGGPRPGFDAAFRYWNNVQSLEPFTGVPFLFGLYPGLSGGTYGVAPGNVTSNALTIYQMDDRWWLTPAEWRLNRDVLRVSRTASPSSDLSGVPRVFGDPPVPVLSLHTIGDLFVPLSMEQVYATRALLHGRYNSFVSRAVRAVGHCEFTAPELQRGFDDLVAWVRTGNRPAGDAILDPRAVANPTFGCRFTVGYRYSFGEPACPAV